MSHPRHHTNHRTSHRSVHRAATGTLVAGLAAGSLAASPAQAYENVTSDIVASTCTVVVQVSDRKPGTPLQVRLQTGAAQTATGTEKNAKGLWQASFPVPKTLPLGQLSLGVEVTQDGTAVGSDLLVLNDGCLTAGLFAPSTTVATSGRVGDSSGSAAADSWLVDTEGSVRYYEWAPRDVGPSIRDELVGARQTQISSMTAVPDLTGDRRADLLVRERTDGSLWLYSNRGDGALARTRQMGYNWNGMDQIAYAGNLVSGSSKTYVIARRGRDSSLWRYELTSTGLRSGVQIGQNWAGMRVVLSLGNQWGDAAWDVVGVRTDGLMYGYRSVGGRLSSTGVIGRGWNNIEAATSPGDINGDGRPDLLAITRDHLVHAYWSLPGRVAGQGLVGEVVPTSDTPDGVPVGDTTGPRVVAYA